MSVSHVEIVTSIVKPMATLILSRKLYLIASLRYVETPNKVQVNIVLCHVFATELTITCTKRRRDSTIEVMLGLVVPFIVAGPFCEFSSMTKNGSGTDVDTRIRLHSPRGPL